MTARGKILVTLVILGVLGIGAWKWWPKLVPQTSRSDVAAHRSRQ